MHVDRRDFATGFGKTRLGGNGCAYDGNRGRPEEHRHERCEQEREEQNRESTNTHSIRLSRSRRYTRPPSRATARDAPRRSSASKRRVVTTGIGDAPDVCET
jgi:hypothetical protein